MPCPRKKGTTSMRATTTKKSTAKKCTTKKSTTTTSTKTRSTCAAGRFEFRLVRAGDLQVPATVRVGLRYARLDPPDAAGINHTPYAIGSMIDWTNSEFGRIRFSTTASRSMAAGTTTSSCCNTS